MHMSCVRQLGGKRGGFLSENRGEHRGEFLGEFVLNFVDVMWMFV